MAIADAIALIPRFGRTVTLVQLDSTVPDAGQPWRGPTNPRSTPTATLSTAACFVPLTGSAALGLSKMTVDLAKKAKATALVAVDASQYNELVDGAVRFKITHMELLKPGADFYISYLVLNQ